MPGPRTSLLKVIPEKLPTQSQETESKSRPQGNHQDSWAKNYIHSGWASEDATFPLPLLPTYSQPVRSNFAQNPNITLQIMRDLSRKGS